MNRKLMPKGVWWDVASCPFPDDKFSLSLAKPCIESALNKYLGPGPVTIYAMVDARKISRTKLKEIASSGILISHYEFALPGELYSFLKSWTSDIRAPAYLLALSNVPLTFYHEDYSKYGYQLIHGRTYPHEPGPEEWYWNWKRLLEEIHEDYLNHDYPNLNTRRKSLFEPPWFCNVCIFSADNPEDFFSHLNSPRHTQEKQSIEEFIWRHDGGHHGPLDIYNPPPLYKYYKAPSSLLHHSHSGFLITCDHFYERLATKEIIPILEKYLGSIDEEKYEVLKSCGMSMPRKQLYLDDEMIEEDEGETILEALQETGENATVQESINEEEHNTLMSLIKLTQTGLLLFTFPVESSADPTDIVSRIFQFMESGFMKKSPKWCYQIFPVQATCGLTEKELRETVSRLVQLFVDDKNNPLSKPLKFAAGYKYNLSGLEDVDQCPLLDRSKCFKTVAAGVKDIVPDAVVNLKSPKLCVLVELLPLSGIPNGSFVAAVSVLPPRLVTKRNFAIKPL